jgi:hypothetical protein
MMALVVEISERKRSRRRSSGLKDSSSLSVSSARRCGRRCVMRRNALCVSWSG